MRPEDSRRLVQGQVGFCVEQFSALRGQNRRSDAEMWEEGDHSSSALCPSDERSAIGYNGSTSYEVHYLMGLDTSQWMPGRSCAAT